MKVKCTASHGYINLTEGKEYEVKSTCGQLITTNFTFPRYVTVIDDAGKESTGHATRFETLDGESMEQWVKANVQDEKDKGYM